MASPTRRPFTESTRQVSDPSSGCQVGRTQRACPATYSVDFVRGPSHSGALRWVTKAKPVSGCVGLLLVASRSTPEQHECGSGCAASGPRHYPWERPRPHVTVGALGGQVSLRSWSRSLDARHKVSCHRILNSHRERPVHPGVPRRSDRARCALGKGGPCGSPCWARVLGVPRSRPYLPAGITIR